MRALMLFVIGLLFGTGFGLLAGGGLEITGHDHATDHDMSEISESDAAHDHEGHADVEHDHSAMTPWPGDPAELSMTLEILPDSPTTRNLHIIADGYDWTPQDVNGPNGTGGHAHVYINGEKVARAYGPWLHLENFPTTGPTTIRVTFNANDHSVWSLNDQPIAAETVVQ